MTETPIKLEAIGGALDLPEDAWYAVSTGDEVLAKVHFSADETYRWVVDSIVIQRDRISSDTLRAIPIGQLERQINIGASTADGTLVNPQPLRRWEGESSRDFYERVGRLYQRYARVSRSPAAEIARDSDVPVRTVHSWIREARKIGALPPGRQGAAG